MRVVQGRKSLEVRAVWLDDRKVKMIDQRLLPQRFRIAEFSDFREVAEAIRNMTIRGAPSIGAAAAYGMALAHIQGASLEEAASLLRSTRPTAHDLFFAVDYVLRSAELGDSPVEAAEGYADQIVERCRQIGLRGASLIEEESNVMVHCNAGALATVDIGTGLAPIRRAWTEGRHLFVYVSETRPRLQGMKLTAWELYNEGIPHAIIVDGASGHFMRKGVNVVVVGADRIAANGDFANKIGTFEKAVLAKELGIPFYVAAPISTFDFTLETGEGIVIENRDEEEVTHVGKARIAPRQSAALNPSFDVTSRDYVTAFITEIGILRPYDIHRVKSARFEQETSL